MSDISRMMERLARCDELQPQPRGRRTISEALFGVRSLSAVPCTKCGNTITMHSRGENDYPLEDGHDPACANHPRNEEPSEWLAFCKQSGRTP